MGIPPKDDEYNVMGFSVSPDIAANASNATHLVANFIPNPLIGSAIDLAASTMDMETNQLNFVKTWKSAISRNFGVSEHDLEGDAGIAFVSTHIGELPEALQNEWHKIEDLEGKTSNFLVSGVAQIGGGALLGMLLGLPGGIIGMAIGLAGGLAAGYVASIIMKDATGDEDVLAASDVVPAIHQSAMQLQQEMANDKGGVPIDTTLLGAYLITAHSGKGGALEGYNTEDLKRMFGEHMAAKAANPHAHTELDSYIQGLNNAEDNPFVLLLPADLDANKIKGGGVLQTIAMNMHSQHDLENWLFDPNLVQAKLSTSAKRHPAMLDQAQLMQAGKNLHHSIDVPMNEQGAPTAHKGTGHYLGT